MTITVTRTEKAKNGTQIKNPFENPLSKQGNSSHRLNIDSSHNSRDLSNEKLWNKNFNPNESENGSSLQFHTLKMLNLHGVVNSIQTMHMHPPYFIIIASGDVLIYSSIAMHQLSQGNSIQLSQDEHIDLTIASNDSTIISSKNYVRDAPLQIEEMPMKSGIRTTENKDEALQRNKTGWSFDRRDSPFNTNAFDSDTISCDTFDFQNHFHLSKNLEPIIHFKSHVCPITASHVFLNSKFNTILLTCCEEKMIMWNIDLITNKEIDNGVVLGQGLGEVVQLDHSKHLIAIALHDCILIFDSNEMSMVCEIQVSKAVQDCKFLKSEITKEHNTSGHNLHSPSVKSIPNGRITRKSSSSTSRLSKLTRENTRQAISESTNANIQQQLLVAENDGSLSIWDCFRGDCLWKSNMETGFGFIRHALSLDCIHGRRIAVACLDGVLKIYEYSIQSVNQSVSRHRPYFKQITSLPEMYQVYMKYFGLNPLTGEKKQSKSEFQYSSKCSDPIWKQQSNYIHQLYKNHTTKKIDTLKLAINAIIYIRHIKCCNHSTLAVGTPRAFFLYDMQSLDALYILDQGDEQIATSYECSTEFSDDEEIIRLHIAYDKIVNSVDIFIGKILNATHSMKRGVPLQSEITGGTMNLRPSNDHSFGTIDNAHVKIEPNEAISIFANGKLPPNLLVEFNSKPTKAPSKIKDKPVTFHTRIKSSGYGNEKPFGYQTKKNVQTNSTNKQMKAPSKKIYPIDSNLPANDVGFKKVAHNAPILAMSLSYDGQKLATCSSDNTARIFRFPLSKSEANCFMSHSNAVTDVKWSMSKNYIITCSLDCKAILWSVERSEPILPFTYTTQNYAKKEQGMNSLSQFKHPIKNAQFFYQDKFVVLSSSNNMSLYRYYIAPLEKDQILHKGLNRNRYKVLLNYKSEAQTFTALACANSFLSNLLFFGGSNRSLQVYDVTKKKIVKSVEDAHSRPISRIILNESPAGNQCAVPDPHQLFATQAPDESIRLWDLRMPRCARQFNTHKNAVHSIGGSFSPCMRYFVCGSEDRFAYVYDFGSGSVISKLQGHTETVSDAVFHPQKPMIITSSFDNCIKLFTV